MRSGMVTKRPAATTERRLPRGSSPAARPRTCSPTGSWATPSTGAGPPSSSTLRFARQLPGQPRGTVVAYSDRGSQFRSRAFRVGRRRRSDWLDGTRRRWRQRRDGIASLAAPTNVLDRTCPAPLQAARRVPDRALRTRALRVPVMVVRHGNSRSSVDNRNVVRPGRRPRDLHQRARSQEVRKPLLYSPELRGHRALPLFTAYFFAVRAHGRILLRGQHGMISEGT